MIPTRRTSSTTDNWQYLPATVAETCGYLVDQGNADHGTHHPLKYSFDIYNLTNTASFDIPINDITQNPGFQGFPQQGTPATLTPCNSSFDQSTTGSLYVCPNLSGLGITNKTIGSARQIQMSLKV